MGTRLVFPCIRVLVFSGLENGKTKICRIDRLEMINLGKFCDCHADVSFARAAMLVAPCVSGKKSRARHLLVTECYALLPRSVLLIARRLGMGRAHLRHEKATITRSSGFPRGMLYCAGANAAEI